ncbi:MAG: ATP phosphoribosyltransferase [Ardenticatenia bacterium]|nr:ATP phosphoribosyltransferase [Ardenticatenia bacterium]
MGNRPLVVAIGKGRLFEESLRLFECMGYDVAPVRRALAERRMLADEGTSRLRFLLAKDRDVPIYVEHGVADVGIAGRDVLWESGTDVLVPLLLGHLMPTSRCRLVLAGPRTWQERNLRLAHNLRVATKYPNVAREYVWRRGLSAEVLGLSGNVELAPASGLADLIVDIVQTGTTLRENNLVELETILDVEACLIVNRAAQKLRPNAIQGLLEALEGLS